MVWLNEGRHICSFAYSKDSKIILFFSYNGGLGTFYLIFWKFTKLKTVIENYTNIDQIREAYFKKCGSYVSIRPCKFRKYVKLSTTGYLKVRKLTAP